MRGSVEPRLFPQPLRELTPETSYGFAVIDFARDVLGRPLDPWQEWIVIHAGELLPDGRPRFKKILLIVARQNGKTELLKVLTLFWLFVEQWPLIVGQHTRVGKAKEVWEDCYDAAWRNPWLKPEVGFIRKDNNDPHWKVASGSKYMIEAANKNGGRGGSVDRLIVDELRQQHTWEAYNAAKPTLNARPYGQGWWITNQGDARSVVLLSLRKTGISNMEGKESIDPELALFEYSAPPGSDMKDPVALAMANPNAGVRVSMLSLLADARSAAESGDRDRINGFKTEIMCMYVPALDGAVDPAGWELGLVPGELSTARGRLAMVPELSPDGLSASVSVAAVEPDGRVRVEVLARWSGRFASSELRRALPGWIKKVRPKKVGWIPNGGAQAIAAELTEEKLRLLGVGGVTVEAIRGEVSAMCMGFAELADVGDILHSGQADLTMQTLASSKLWTGDTWRFSRKGDGYCDQTYGVAGAAHLARTMAAGGHNILKIVGGSSARRSSTPEPSDAVPSEQ